MMFKLFLFFFGILSVHSSWANNKVEKQLFINVEIHENLGIECSLDICIDTLDNNVRKPVKFKRGKLIIFTIFTGLFGGHRIYLGTHQRTPILYSITLGGLGILPLIDLVNIIFTKDLSKFETVPQIIMWGR